MAFVVVVRGDNVDIYYDDQHLGKIKWWWPEYHFRNIRRKFSPDHINVDFHRAEIRIYSNPIEMIVKKRRVNRVNKNFKLDL